MLEGFYFQPPERMSRGWPSIVWSLGARGKRATALAGGLGSLPEALARTVRVCLSTPALAIDTSGAGVSVGTATGSLQADRPSPAADIDPG